MSRKKANKSDYSSFAKNINTLCVDNGGKYAFADALGVVYDSVRRWCNGENIPDGDTLLAIHEKFNVSIDWLLTGKESVETSAEQFMCGWKPEVREACRTVRKILESSDRVTSEALLMNINAFEMSIEKDKTRDQLLADIERMKRDIEELKRVSDLKRFTGTD